MYINCTCFENRLHYHVSSVFQILKFERDETLDSDSDTVVGGLLDVCIDHIIITYKNYLATART